MTTITGTVTRVSDRAGGVDWRNVLLIVLMALPFAIAYAIRLTLRAFGWVLAWLWAACVEGWAMAAPGQDAVHR